MAIPRDLYDNALNVFEQAGVITRRHPMRKWLRHRRFDGVVSALLEDINETMHIQLRRISNL